MSLFRIPTPTPGTSLGLALFALLTLAACGGGGGDTLQGGGAVSGGTNDIPHDAGGSGGTPLPDGTAALTGGALATFVDRSTSEQFRVWVTHGPTIDRLAASWDGTMVEVLDIKVGIGLGPGAGDHNVPWSWHVRPNGFEVNELARTMGFPIGATPGVIERDPATYAEPPQPYLFIVVRMTAFDDRR